jgi:hypothetical protein
MKILACLLSLSSYPRISSVNHVASPFTLLDAYIEHHSKEHLGTSKAEHLQRRFVSAGYACPNQVTLFAKRCQ